MLKFSVAAALIASSLSFSSANAEPNILFILDGSNSMWGQIGGKAKIDTAKSVLNDTLTKLAKDVVPGLMIYGHRERNNCGDVELIAPLGSTTISRLKRLINEVTPTGKTPIAASLKLAGDAFAGREEENNSILLISDGIETCGGNVCEMAGSLAKRGVNVQVHVIGFDVDDAAREQLQCIAKEGNGKYFNADNASEFQQAVQQVQAIVVAPTPVPEPEPEPEPEPVIVATGPVIYFEDNFDADNLSQDWDLLNPDPDNYLVENGLLTMIARDGTQATFAASENILRLSKPIPKGDWSITARILFTPQTMGENFRIGVAKDNENSLFTSFQLTSANYVTTAVDVRTDKMAKGVATGFGRNILEISSRDIQVRSESFSDRIMAVQVRLSKSGRNYVASARLESTAPGADGAVSEEWLTVQQLTSLRTPGDAFTIIFGSNSNNYVPDQGEGLIELDWVKVEVPG